MGLLVGVAYTLRALQKAFFADRELETETRGPVLDPVSLPEKCGAMILMAATLIIGLYPRLLLDLIVPSFSSPLFDGLRNGAGL